MSSSIDNRVVQMTFNNSDFERKLDATLQSLARLEKSLNFEQSRKNIQQLESTTRQFNLGEISTHIEGVSKKFLALSTIALTTLSQITKAALHTGTKLAKALSLELVIDGFREYETNIGSIQTILANTASDGTQLKDVTAALDELNEYSDKTIYNFGEMTRNIGTFSAAGVDLDTSVKAIKGIANLAAISGSNSQQASTAMYQLSQALAAGSVKLMDWNSIVNAGMGGEVFQKALFESGKALKTIEGVGIDTTFEAWTKAGNTFRGSLEKGWLTAEVLTNTLQGFTGELTEAQLISMGYTKEQAKEIDRLGKLGVDSATKVRTLTQLIATVKESIGSGWSQSFRIIFGDFEEATELFTEVSNAIGAMVGKMSDARNELLQGWKNLGGRIILLEGLRNAFRALGEILAPIKRAFHDVFPPVTSERLFELTKRFAEFARAARPSEETVNRIQIIFRGLFSAIRIGMEVFRVAAGFVGKFLGSFIGKGEILHTAADIFDFITRLRLLLVEGKGIENFFNRMVEAIKNPMPIIDKLKRKVEDFFESIRDWISKKDLSKLSAEIPALAPLGGILDRLKQRFEQVKGAVQKLADVWDAISGRFERIKDILSGVFDYVVNWFRTLGEKLAEAMKPGDFDAAVDAVNVGLIGGLLVLLKKFLDDGLKLDFGGGFMEKISEAIGQLTGVLEAMQANLKAEALQKIAIAIGIITASLLVLSLIDSAALTKALTAMAIGFGQLISVTAAMSKITAGPAGAAGFVALASGMVLISTAMVIFAGAVSLFARMEWDELGRGLAGITGGLTVMVGATVLLGNASGPMVRAAFAMILMSGALIVLAKAISAFGEMSWKEIGKGLTVVAASLLAIGLALSLVPPSAPLIGAGFVLVATGLVILAQALEQFGQMSWKEIGKSLTVLAGSLVAIGLAMTLMPPWLPVTAAGLLITAGALIVLAEAMEKMGSIPGGTIAKSIGAIAAALIVLSVGMLAMTVGMAGAPALMLTAIALGMLINVIQEFAKIKTGDIVKGLLGMVAVFTVLGLAAAVMAPLTPILLALGAALVLVGAGFALLGAGALLTAKAIEILAKSGKKGIEVVFEFMDGLIERFPQMMTLLAKTLLETAQTLLDGAAPLIKALVVVVEHMLDGLIELMPKFYKWASDMITNLLKIIQDKSPEFVETGFQVLLDFLHGLEENIDEITEVAGDIIIKFLEGLQEKVPEIVKEAYGVIGAFISGVAQGVPQLIAAGAELIVEILRGIGQELDEIIKAGADVVISYIKGLSGSADEVAKAAAKMITNFIGALANAGASIIKAGGDFIVKLLKGIADNIYRIAEAVGDIIDAFISAFGENTQDIIRAGGTLIVNVIKGIGQEMTEITDAAAEVIVEFIKGIDRNARDIIDAGTDMIVHLMEGLGENSREITEAVGDMLLDFVTAVADEVDKKIPEFRRQGLRIFLAILDGATFGMAGRIARFLGDIVGIFNDAKKAVEQELQIKSPSKVFYKIGEQMMMGTALAIENDKSVVRSAIGIGEKTTKAFQDSLRVIPEKLGQMREFNPTITPVLDLSEVRKKAVGLSRLFTGEAIDPFAVKAVEISKADTSFRTSAADLKSAEVRPATEIKFEQNNYSPKELSAKDIYRRTRSQITLAKEELSIP